MSQEKREVVPGVGRLPPRFILLVIFLCFAQLGFPALLFNEEHLAGG